MVYIIVVVCGDCLFAVIIMSAGRLFAMGDSNLGGVSAIKQVLLYGTLVTL